MSSASISSRTTQVAIGLMSVPMTLQPTRLASRRGEPPPMKQSATVMPSNPWDW